MIEEVNKKLWNSVEEHLTPLPANSNQSSILHYSGVLPRLGLGLVTLCLEKVEKLFTWVFIKQKTPDPKKEFPAVCADSRLWKQIDLKTEEPLGTGNPDFLWGAATCTYQDSGAENCPKSQWAEWEKKAIKDPDNRSGKSANLFELYKTEGGRQEVIQRLLRAGLNSYRFSIEWSQIEPAEGAFSRDALDVYVQLCKDLRKNGITPMVTLHHFSEPKWFHDAGSFEKEENIRYFVRFAEFVFPELTQPDGNMFDRKPLVEHFCTINEPGIEAFSRYIFGTFSPGCMAKFSRAGHFLKGALKAHCAVYKALKPRNGYVKIGITHQRLTFLPGNVLLPPFTLMCRYLTRLINDTTLQFFKTGNFDYKIPFSCNIQEKGLDPQTDFVGLQYYVRPLIGHVSSHEEMTKMPFREDPAGLYEAIVETHAAFQKPVIITENGCSAKNEEQRSRYLERALFAARKAQKVIGEYNLLGYYLWSFSDNSEWERGMKPQDFGMYGLNPSGYLNHDPKAGTLPLTHTIEKWRAGFGAAAAIA